MECPTRLAQLVPIPELLSIYYTIASELLAQMNFWKEWTKRQPIFKTAETAIKIGTPPLGDWAVSEP